MAACDLDHNKIDDPNVEKQAQRKVGLAWETKAGLIEKGVAR